MKPTPFVLTFAERNSPLWIRLHEYLTERLEVKRRANDNRAPQPETDFLRGEIAQLKAIRALGGKDEATGS